MEFLPEHMKVLVETEARSKSNTHRIDELSGQIDAVNRLATAVEVMATEQKHQSEATAKIDEKVATLTDKVDAIEKKPAKRWETVAEKALLVVVGAVVAYLLAKVGL